MSTQSVLQPGVQIQDFYSNIMEQELQLFVKLPWCYENEEINFPVLFVLDANQNFPIYSTLSMVYEKFIEPSQMIIIIGIGYKLDKNRSKALAQFASWRTRDLTPIQNRDVEQRMQDLIQPSMSTQKVSIQTGMAGRFLKVINEEIIPFIESNYRVLEMGRGLAGYSFGGLFALYALLHTPRTFTRYIAGSPSMWKQLFKYEQDYADNYHDLPAHLFLSAGGFEKGLVESMKKFTEQLKSHAYTNLALNIHIFENENHFTAMAASITRGLCWHYYQDIIDKQ